MLQARIKKIMQADEEVGKIAMAVPVLVCELSQILTSMFRVLSTLLKPLAFDDAAKALELFLQDLCDRTYNITLQRGARTVSSVHL